MSINIEQLVGQMTLDQKNGATLNLGFAGTIPKKHIYDYITKYHCGGLRLSPVFRKFGNYIYPNTGEVIVNVECSDKVKGVPPAYMTASDYKGIIDEFKELAGKRPLQLPLHFSYDQEGGTSADFNFGGVALFPKPMGIRATNDPEIYTRAYSDLADVVTEYAIKTCEGLKEAGMIATGKHFPGRGASAVDAHYELPIIDVDKETLLSRDLAPYRALIEKDLLPSIMLAHSIYPAIDPDDVATVSKKIVTGLLREELGFKGVITTDSMTMGALAVRYGVENACAMSLEAGCDLILMKAENHMVEGTFNKIKEFVENGRIPMEELNQKVTRILTMKKEYGMFEQKNINPNTVIQEIKDSQLPKDLAYKSILPMQRVKDVTLPLSKTKTTLVIEQLNKNVPNDVHWHYGYLYQQCVKRGANADLYEIDYMITEEDFKEAILRAKDYEQIIVTNFYVRSRTANNEFIQKLQDELGNKVVVINNTPYKLSTPEGANNILTTLATTPENLKAVAGILFEGEKPEGVWPLGLTEEHVYV